MLMNIKDFQPGSGRIKVSEMNCITMAKLCIIQRQSVIVDCHRAEGYFVLAVAVHISYRKIVVSLTNVVSISFIIRIETPYFLELALAIIVSCKYGSSIITAAKNHAWLLAV
ncbi:hypothetical protein D3C76_884810 [compost metagenome]